MTKREQVGLPRRYAVEWKVVPFVRSPTDWRIDFEPVPLAKLSELSVERLARIGRIVVLGVEEEKRDDGSTRGVEEAGAELRRTVPAVASGGEDDGCAQCLLAFGHEHAQRTTERMADDRHPTCVNIRKTPHERQRRASVGQFRPSSSSICSAFLALCPVCRRPRGPSRRRRSPPGRSMGPRPAGTGRHRRNRTVRIPGRAFRTALVRAEALQLLASAAAAVVDEDCGKRTTASGPPHVRVERRLAARYGDQFRAAILAPGPDGREHLRHQEHDQKMSGHHFPRLCRQHSR